MDKWYVVVWKESREILVMFADLVDAEDYINKWQIQPAPMEISRVWLNIDNLQAQVR